MESVCNDKKVRELNVSSDEFSSPTIEMLNVMSDCQVGDDVYNDDETGNKFQNMIANLFGKQSGLFTPTSQMSNMISIMSWTLPGNQIIIASTSNILQNSSKSLAILGSVMTRQIQTQNGIFSIQDIKHIFRKASDHVTYPTTSLIVIENPTSTGQVWPLQTLRQLYQFANSKNVKIHMDGQRIFNAFQYYKVKYPKQVMTLKDIALYCDSISVCLDRGLSCPIGGVVISTKQAIQVGRQIRKSLGGGLRQIGVLTAAGIYALQNCMGVFKEDNDIAIEIGKRLEQIKGIMVQQIQVNIINFSIIKNQFDRNKFEEYLCEKKIKLGHGSRQNVYRIYCYNKIRKEQVNRLVNIIQGYFS